jgi:hypothetical protein
MRPASAQHVTHLDGDGVWFVIRVEPILEGICIYSDRTRLGCAVIKPAVTSFL